MKKKILIVLFTMAISMSLYACNKNTNETANNDVQNQPTETATQEEESSTEIESTTQEEFSTEIETTTQEESSTETESTAQQSQPVVEQPKVEQSQPVVEQPKVEQSQPQQVVEQPNNNGGDHVGFDGINPATGEVWKEGDVMSSGFIYNGDNSEVSKLFGDY